MTDTQTSSDEAETSVTPASTEVEALREKLNSLAAVIAGAKHFLKNSEKGVTVDRAALIDRLEKCESIAARPLLRRPEFWGGVATLPAILISGQLISYLASWPEVPSAVHRALGVETATRDYFTSGSIVRSSAGASELSDETLPPWMAEAVSEVFRQEYSVIQSGVITIGTREILDNNYAFDPANLTVPQSPSLLIPAVDDYSIRIRLSIQPFLVDAWEVEEYRELLFDARTRSASGACNFNMPDASIEACRWEAVLARHRVATRYQELSSLREVPSSFWPFAESDGDVLQSTAEPIGGAQVLALETNKPRALTIDGLESLRTMFLHGEEFIPITLSIPEQSSGTLVLWHGYYFVEAVPKVGMP